MARWPGHSEGVREEPLGGSGARGPEVARCQRGWVGGACVDIVEKPGRNGECGRRETGRGDAAEASSGTDGSLARQIRERRRGSWDAQGVRGVSGWDTAWARSVLARARREEG